VHGIVYLENNSVSNAFINEHIYVLELLASQITTLIDNSRIYAELADLNKNLEAKVQERTIEIQQQKEEITAQRDEIEQKSKVLESAFNEITKQNKNITDSIRYAERIQQSILPTQGFVEKVLPNSFILLKPKEVLSGDFYWIDVFPPAAKDINAKAKNILIAAVDCTGHGVPGALLSVMANNLLNNALKEYHLTQPHDILNHVQTGVRAYLKQKTNGKINVQDGMDIALVNYDTQTRKLLFAGAKNPIYIVRADNKLEIIRGERFSVGGASHEKYENRLFTSQETTLNENDVLYMFSDGFADQFGGAKGRKFKYSSFQELLLAIHSQPPNKQGKLLDEAITRWMSGFVQIDDILVIGVKFI